MISTYCQFPPSVLILLELDLYLLSAHALQENDDFYQKMCKQGKTTVSKLYCVRVFWFIIWLDDNLCRPMPCESSSMPFSEIIYLQCTTSTEQNFVIWSNGKTIGYCISIAAYYCKRKQSNCLKGMHWTWLNWYGHMSLVLFFISQSKV